VLYKDIMEIIRWSEIAQPGDCLHVANILLGRMRTPALHRHDFFECFFVLEGAGEQGSAAGVQPLSPGDLYFLRPEHAHVVSGDGLSFLNLAFEARLFDSVAALAPWGEGIWEPGAPIAVQSLNSAQGQRLVEAATAVARQPSGINAAWLLLGLARILAESSGRPEARSPLPEWLAEGIAVAKQPEVLREGLPLLVQRMGRSRKHVSRSFQQYLGQTPTAWLAAARIERAQTLLATSGRSVLEVALDCGFASPSHFHKCFREALGVTPLQYRKRLAGVQLPGRADG